MTTEHGCTNDLIRVYGVMDLPPATENRPLVTFALFAYNQERFIRDAVLGAFSQTYWPLEIILSDDFSSDRTFEIIEEMAAAYSGPHRVVVRRNSKNYGVNEHINRVINISKGDLIVMAAGDDISYAHRVSTIVQHWVRGGKRVVAISSKVHLIDESGRLVGDAFSASPKTSRNSLVKYCWNPRALLRGATSAYAKSLFHRFSGLPGTGNIEDLILGFRALLSDGILFIDDHLVRYRRSGTSLSSWTAYYDPRRRVNWIDSLKIALQTHIEDLTKALPGQASLRALLSINLMRLELSRRLARTPAWPVLMLTMPGLSILGRIAMILSWIGIKENSFVFRICLRTKTAIASLNPWSSKLKS
jgi:glycosyltransferase involved in cell wall biosynthesis